MNKICPTCGKKFHHLGYARHRTMHYENRLKVKEEFLKWAKETLDKKDYKIAEKYADSSINELIKLKSKNKYYDEVKLK